MSTPERKRITVNLSQEAFDRLEHLAEQRGMRYGKVANEILTDLLLHGTIPTAPVPAPRPAAAPPFTSEDGEEGPLPAWLEMDRGRPWRVEAWAKAQQLRQDYPRELHRLPADWTTDRFARDGILALAEWRAQIDAGASAEPPAELAWLDSLRRFSGWLEQRARENPDHLPEHARPKDWTP